MRASQKVREIGSVTVRCEVGEKIWGYNAVKFIKIIVVKANLIIFSVLFSLLFSVKFTSLLKVFTVFIYSFLTVEDKFHIVKGTNRGIKRRMVHEREKIAELGSNTENKLFIILLCSLCV